VKRKKRHNDPDLRSKAMYISVSLPVLQALEGVRPLLNGSSGAYLGVYKHAAATLCRELEWETYGEVQGD